MTPPEAAKSYGLKTLSQAAKLHGIHPETLGAWFTEKPELFRAACERAAIVLGLRPDYRDLLVKCLRAAEWKPDELEVLKSLLESDAE